MGRTLTDLGKAIASAQDEAQRGADLVPGRDRLLRAVNAGRGAEPAQRPPLARSRGPWIALAAALAVAAIVIGLGRRPPLSFHAGSDAGREGAWIAAPSDRALPLRFSDGTMVSLGQSARVRVADLDRRGARVILERGQLTASVVHRSETRWRVDVGPFEVRVTGTRFDVAWSPEDETFKLALHEGSVEVTGPVLGERRTVRAGETVVVSCVDRKLTIRAGDKPEEARSAAAPPASVAAPIASAPAREAPPPPLPPQASASTIASASSPPRPSYRDLAKTGRYADAVRAAEEEGFGDVCNRAGADDLMALADAARLAGSGARAIEALTAIRRRFPGHPHAATAAFVLGRAAFDQRGAYGEAARWFSLYLQEQPGGSLAREALGRLMECRERSGDRAGAREVAERYLAAYPSGAHADKAKRLLEP